MRLTDLLELVRAPAVLTVVGDTAVGRSALPRPARPSPISAAALSGASALLYSAGMALNDYADADLDARERPERPIPSGRVSRTQAGRLGVGLLVGGLACAGTAGRSHLTSATGVAAAVLAYDLWAKETAAGPVFMALCRALDVQLGASGGHWRLWLPASLAMGAHTAAVTTLSRGEVVGAPRWAALAAALTTTGVAAWAITARSSRQSTTASRRSTAALALAYLAVTLPAQGAAVVDPTPVRARAATREGIRAMIPLQALLVARHGDTRAATRLGALAVATRVLTHPRVRAALRGSDLT